MPHATLQMDGKKFILVPLAEYRRLQRGNSPLPPSRRTAKPTKSSPAAREAGDIAEATRRLNAGGFKPYANLRKELGL
jgi:hypothetical protein